MARARRRRRARGLSADIGPTVLNRHWHRSDAGRATLWLERAAELGNPASQADFANLVLRDGGKLEDQVKTRHWFERAAETGDLIAAFNFGVCFAEGVGVERDDQKAAQWLRRAAEGVTSAQYWYGRMLIEGRGVPANATERT